MLSIGLNSCESSYENASQVEAAPLGLSVLSDLVSQGSATFADTCRSTLGWLRSVPSALKTLERIGRRFDVIVWLSVQVGVSLFVTAVAPTIPLPTESVDKALCSCEDRASGFRLSGNREGEAPAEPRLWHARTARLEPRPPVDSGFQRVELPDTCDWLPERRLGGG
jgi:hypothetical protein